jgi:hypothetical protein
MQAVTYHAELLPPSAALNVSPPDRQCVFLNVLPEAAMAANERANESEVARNSPLRRPMHLVFWAQLFPSCSQLSEA